MNTEENQTLKIRFKLPNGEEFEAEGPQAFIEQQRAWFLAFIDKHNAPHAGAPLPVQPSSRPSGTYVPNEARPLANENNRELYFWEKLLKEDGETLVLRQKTKLAPQDLAAILLAGARALLKKPAYSALELAKSFKACGGPEGRLDRLLAGELQAGRIVAEGAKRSRTYR